MNIVSWNVNGIRAWAKKGGFDWFLSVKPDIFCVQETKAEVEQIPEVVAKPEGYNVYFDHSKTRKGYSGVGIYTKLRPDKVVYGLGEESLDKEGRMISIFFGKLVIMNIYFPNGGGGPGRLEFKMRYYDSFLVKINSLREQGFSIIFCGDVNTAHNEIDLARPKENIKHSGFMPIERDWLDKLVRSGYVDIFRYFNPNTKDIYTYWDMKTYARERNVGWRIDYFFVTQDLVNKVKSATIYDSVIGSDHCPIGIELDVKL